MGRFREVFERTLYHEIRDTAMEGTSEGARPFLPTADKTQSGRERGQNTTSQICRRPPVLAEGGILRREASSMEKSGFHDRRHATQSARATRGQRNSADDTYRCDMCERYGKAWIATGHLNEGKETVDLTTPDLGGQALDSSIDLWISVSMGSSRPGGDAVSIPVPNRNTVQRVYSCLSSSTRGCFEALLS